MANVLRFEIETDAPYTEEERIELLDSFLAFAMEADGDVVEGTEDLKIVRKEDAKKPVISDEQRREIVAEFLNDTSLVATITLEDADGTIVRKANLRD